MSLNINICRNLFFLYIPFPKLTPSNCFLVSWCPLMLGWENTPRAGKHPHQFLGRGREREEPISRVWRVSSTGHGRKVLWGSTPEGSCWETSIPLQWPPPVPEKQWRSCLGWLLCRLCSLCLQKAKLWLVWQPSSEHPRMLDEEQALWRKHWGVSGGGSSCAKGYEGQERPMQSHIYLENCFVGLSGFLEAKITPVYNTILLCFSRRGKQ